MLPYSHHNIVQRNIDEAKIELCLCSVLQSTWHFYFSMFWYSHMELNTQGTFNFRLRTNQMCQTTQLHLKIISPSGRKCNTAAAKGCSWAENTHIPNLVLRHYHLCISPPLPNSLTIPSSSLIPPEEERKLSCQNLDDGSIGLEIKFS